MNQPESNDDPQAENLGQKELALTPEPDDTGGSMMPIPESSEPAGDHTSDDACDADALPGSDAKVSETHHREDDQGPGCMPAMVAAAALMGIIGFITCALLTWVIFGKRTEMAVRTLEGSLIPMLEQSLLDPTSKQEVIQEMTVLAENMKANQYENWQSAAIMQRLQKLPILQWGELQSLEQSIRDSDGFDDGERQAALATVQRVKIAVKQHKVFSFDFEDILDPIRQPSNSSLTGFIPKSPLDVDSMREAIRRAELLANRAEVENPEGDQNVRISEILRGEIQAGIESDS
ncbi:MAG: hypothetical protein L7U72_04640 [Rubripirellula sp.]|nr:hypothetical protein [Rubripirellula sp.]